MCELDGQPLHRSMAEHLAPRQMFHHHAKASERNVRGWPEPIAAHSFVKIMNRETAAAEIAAAAATLAMAMARLAVRWAILAASTAAHAASLALRAASSLAT